MPAAAAPTSKLECDNGITTQDTSANDLACSFSIRNIPRS